MQSTSALKLKTRFVTKILLIIFGLFFSLILLEIGLRIGGFVLLSLQDYRNSQGMQQKGAYRIMCLGESTTQDQYPVFLEEILNQCNTGIKFSVIDKGLDGTTTSAILERLNYDLDKYRPDMVVAMMGINDWGVHIPYETATASKSMRLFKSFRIYKLARFLWLHILTKVKEMGLYKSDDYKQHFGRGHLTGDSFKKSSELNSKEVKAYFELGRRYEDEGKFSQAEAEFNKAIKTSPKNYQTYFKLGRFYRDQGKFSESARLFKKAIELNPKNNRAYFELGRFYREQGRLSQAEGAFKKALAFYPEDYCVYIALGELFQNEGKSSQAEDLFKKAIELDRVDGDAYLALGRLYRSQNNLLRAEEVFKNSVELNLKSIDKNFEFGWFYQDEGKCAQAENTFKKAIEINPKNYNIYIGLGRLYHYQRKFAQAEGLFMKAIELCPDNYHFYIDLGWLYIDQGKLFQAEASFKKARVLNHDEKYCVYAATYILYEEMGKLELAKEYAKKANNTEAQYHNLVLLNNYRKLKDILDKRKIRLVCVQYPMCNIGPLKKIFQDNEQGIIFVDNEKIFRDAVRKGGSMMYFRDMFGGAFGHCTDKGNRLLAGKIASVLLKEVFNK